MGLEYYVNHFNAICDECDKTIALKEYHWNNAGKKLRSLGWVRVDYVNTAPHYLWLCPRCKGKQMTLPTSILAYQDCTDIMQRAIEDEVGARVKVADQADAFYQRNRMNYARRLHREENKKVYNEGDNLYGRSEYDVLVLKIRQHEDGWYIYLERVDKKANQVESLSDLPAEKKVEKPKPPLSIQQVLRRV